MLWSGRVVCLPEGFGWPGGLAGWGVFFPGFGGCGFSPRGEMVVWDTVFNCFGAIFFQFCELSLNPLSAVIVSPDGMGSCDMSK